MLKDITLGQYFPGNSAVHRLDARSKLIILLIFICLLFATRNPVAVALLLGSVTAVVLISGIKPKMIFKGMKPLFIIVVATALLNVFYTSGEVLWSFWVLKITREGVHNAIFMVLRILMIVTASLLLTYTTSPIDLTDAMESLLNPLKRFRFPVHELSMMTSIALRFIPTLIEETDKIISAQKARGADFDTGGIIDKAKAMLPLLIPLFVSSFRRADELAVAMESRCYHGGEGRTKMKQLHYTGLDVAAFCLIGLLALAIILLGVFAK